MRARIVIGTIIFLMYVTNEMPQFFTDTEIYSIVMFVVKIMFPLVILSKR